MNVRTLCLAILFAREATGYEIKKLSTEGEYAYFVDASFGSIYPALDRMEREGFVTCRKEDELGKPSRKVYSITDAGRAHFVDSLFDLPAPDVFRSEFLLVVMHADILPKPVMRRAIDHRIEQIEGDIAKLRQIAQANHRGGPQWAINYGLDCMQHALAYLHAHRDELETCAELGATSDTSQPGTSQDAARIAAE
ncbi:DNA-binding PadR family transcriptional regulator [Rhodopseudomonas julia]|uniref:DNA-binding PadR family transcriptional regulator n=1 Tax=Rhodopseudomonas julia TaxID=200617 RepID=A0ABU0C2Y3_9BRAD|nr:PadR family transcriptional regulator [Rhodopseudomonas julia]MDQ0324309.1 DNA-binding PadR family transcriptional regulator [Rhodopseudomonas julia]